MSTMRVYTREFRESAVSMVLSQGLSIRVAAEDLGMPYHTLHSWVRDKRRGRLTDFFDLSMGDSLRAFSLI